MTYPRGLALLALFTSGCFWLRGVESPTNAPPGWYRVSIERALIDSSKEGGRVWDIGVVGAEAPDVYAQILYEDHSYKTPVSPNSFQPMWVGSFDALLGVSPGPATMRVLVWDRDPFSDDPIGDVTLDLYQVISSGGAAVIPGFGRVSEISLSVRYQGPAAPKVSAR
jgi:hypothetical protein